MYNQADLFEEDNLKKLFDYIELNLNVSKTILMGTAKQKHVVEARNLAWYGIYYGLSWSSTEIGMFFNKDHTTVLHGLRRLAHSTKSDQTARKHCLNIITMLNPDIKDSHRIVKWLTTQQIDLTKHIEHVNETLVRIDRFLSTQGYELSCAPH